MTHKELEVRQLPGLFKEAFSEFSRDNVLRLSAALSYYSLFSIAPLLMIAIGIVGWVYGAKAAEGRVAAELSQFVGWQAGQALESVVQSASKSSGGATLVGFVTLLVGASSVFGQLKDTLNTIWKVRSKPGLGIWHFVRTYLLNFGLVLGVGFLLLVSLILSTFVAALGGWLQHRFGIPGLVSGIFGFIVPFLLEVLIFAALFRVLPDVEIEWRSVWVGAATTAFLFEIGKVGLSLYLGRGGATSSFGAAGSVVLLLLWVYYASCILFYGAEFTEVYARRMGHNPKPSPLAEATEVWTPQGRLPVECVEATGTSAAGESVPVQPHPLATGARPPALPARETLAPLTIEPAGAYDALASTHRRELNLFHTWMRNANEHPVAEVGAAVGLGLFAGMIMRLMDRRT